MMTLSHQYLLIFLTSIFVTGLWEKRIDTAFAFSSVPSRGSSVRSSRRGGESDERRRRRSRPSGGAGAGADADGVSNDNSGAGPKGESRNSNNTRRRRQRPSAKDAKVVAAFDPKKLTSLQTSNYDGNVLDIDSYESSGSHSPIRMRPPPTIPGDDPHDSRGGEKGPDGSASTLSITKSKMIEHAHLEQLSLDQLFPNLDFSKRFCSDKSFRDDIRTSVRKDVFDSTPAYAKLSPKVALMMLDDDSSLQGSWYCGDKNCDQGGNSFSDVEESSLLRMKGLTKVLKGKLGPDAPTGDEFLMKIGGLCGEKPSTHWIDIIGIKDRKISHSWHQDSGISIVAPNINSANDDDDSDNDGEEGDNDGNNDLKMSRYTVMLGFPAEDEYVGTGVFSHSIKLTKESLSPPGHNINEPVLFEGTVEDEYIVRPLFSVGNEILRYRDVDVLHSAPDVAYRASVMRFM